MPINPTPGNQPDPADMENPSGKDMPAPSPPASTEEEVAAQLGDFA